MTPEGHLKLKSLLINDEGYKQFPYTDTTGHLSVGIGRNLVDRGISFLEAVTLLENDISYVIERLTSLLPYFNDLDEMRQIVLINMCFNLGVQGLLKFEKMLEFCKNNDFEKASEEILDSEAAEQNPNRYKRLAFIMKNGQTA